MVSSHNHLQRVKRQLSFVQCPSGPARSRSSNTRAVVVLYSPQTRQDVNIVQRKSDWQAADVDKLAKAGFDPNKPTLLYTHGFTQAVARSFWLKEIRERYNELTDRGSTADQEQVPFNLMFFDWSDYNARNYAQTASYVPYLGKVLASYLEQMNKRLGYPMSKMHIISYSLSTHISGVAGRKLAAKNLPLAQITALDPTGVCFQSDSSDFSKKYTLKPSDAKLVVAKHYDMFRLGSQRPVGGVDIFVNGGSDQPAMLPRKINGIQILGSAGGFTSHTRASEHESEAFDDTCHEMAYACRSYRSFLAGECGDCGKRNDKCWLASTLGAIELNVDEQQQQVAYKPNTKMYLKTGRQLFCLHQYQVVAKLANPNATKGAIKKAIESGGLGLELVGGNEVEVTPKNRVSDSQYTSLLSLEQKLANFPEEIQVISTYPGKTVRDMLEALKYVDIKYMSNVDPQQRLRSSARYCPNKQRGNTLVKCS